MSSGIKAEMLECLLLEFIEGLYCEQMSWSVDCEARTWNKMHTHLRHFSKK